MPSLREDAIAIGRAGVVAADPAALTRAALVAPDVRDGLARARAVRAVAVGKASAAMWTAAAPLLAHVVEALVIGPAMPDAGLAPPATPIAGGHPLPTAGSEAAARAALDLARRVGPDERLLLLVSGGASALMAAPAGGLSLDDKILTTRALLRCGAEIAEINTVRKHLSAVKGGRLARAAGGRCLTLALSDVIGTHEDDLSVIGSGPGVPDATSFADALRILDARGIAGEVPRAVMARLDAGARGAAGETPKAHDADMRAIDARVIGGRRDAMRGAAGEAERRGYVVDVIEAPLLGEARETAVRFVRDALDRARRGAGRGACVIASGETTVTVRGGGRGGRNQEFALAASRTLAAEGAEAALLSLGTDGIDGPTDAAGGLVDRATVERAAARGVSIDLALADNDAYVCLARLGDLVVTGPTGTNVGDLVVMTVA